MYPEIQLIIDTMNEAKFNFKKDYTEPLENMKKRQAGQQFTIEEHLEKMIYAMLSAQQDWEIISSHKNELNIIFHYFDKNYLANANPEDLVKEIKDIRCGNVQIRSQMAALKKNISILEDISKEYGSVDNYYNSVSIYELVTSLGSPKGKYKLGCMEIPLVSEYLKNMGINMVKPDRHVCRILGRLGYSKHSPAKIEETLNICHDIALDYGMTDIEIDGILWQYCADKGFHQCVKNNPNCAKCKVSTLRKCTL